MTYLAIARKYRPTTFDQIVGQEHVTRTLRHALERGRIHHAFLFTGARGVGKTTAARALARSLNCEHGPTPTPCGECLSCTEITAGMSPDLIEIDGASNNSVDDVRELRETVRYAPTHGKYKIYLIDEVHMLSKGAFNALLKTLEEPPPHVVFLFATTEPNKIPDTILSRVQRFDFKRIPVAAVVTRLRTIADSEGTALSDEALRLIARAGEGSMRDAESLLDQVISFAGADVADAEVAEILGLIDRSLLYETLGGLLSGEPERCLDAIDQVYRYGYELSQFTNELLEVLRNATFLRLSERARAHVDLAADEVERLDALTADVEPEVLGRLFAALLDVHDQVSRAGRPRIVLEMAVARLATLRPVEPVGALLGRLEALERRLRGGGNPSPISGMQGRGGSPAPPRGRGGSRAAPRTPRPAEPAQQATPSPAEPPPAPPPKVAPPAAEPTNGTGDPWAGFLGAIAKVSRAAALADGDATLAGDALTVALRSRRALAAARRATALPEVADALARFYPPGTRIEVVEQAREGADPGEVLKQKALQDPDVRRIVEVLGADLERVTPLDEGETA